MRRGFAAGAEQHETDGRCIFGLLHGIGQAGDGRRDADAHGQAEDFSRGRFDAAQMRAAAGDDDFAEHLIARKMFEDVRFREPEHFEHARQDDRAQLRRGDLARAAPVERLDVKRLLGFVRTREPRAVRALDVFGLGRRRLEPEGDVVTQDVPADRDRRAVDHAAVGKNRDVGRAAADVEQDAADVLFFRKQRCRRRCQGLEHDPGRFQTGTMHAFEHVGDERRAAGDDVRVDFEPAAGHPKRIGYAILAVDRVMPRQGMDDLAVGCEVDDLRCIDDALHVGGNHFAVVARYRDHAAIIRRLNMFAGYSNVHVGHVDAGHPLGLFGRRFDRPDRLLEIGHDAFAHPRRGGFADPDDLQTVGTRGGDDGTRFRRADV